MSADNKTVLNSNYGYPYNRPSRMSYILQLLNVVEDYANHKYSPMTKDISTRALISVIFTNKFSSYISEDELKKIQDVREHYPGLFRNIFFQPK